MWIRFVKKYSGAAWLIFKDPKEFSLRLRRELNRPSILPLRLFRRLYFLFTPRFTGNNDNRILLVYDLKVNPVTFDFLHILYYAERLRITSAKTHLDVLFVNSGKLNEYLGKDYIKSIGKDNISWRINNVLFPITRLIKSVDRVFVVDEILAFEIVDSYKSVHPKGYSSSQPKSAIVHLQDTGFKYVEPLHISPTALDLISKYFPHTDDRIIVTITIRKYEYLTVRNSNIQAWIQFAKELDPTKYMVVIIPDASRTGIDDMDEFNGFEVFDQACWNIELRAALYSRASINMGVDGGPLAISCMLDNVVTVMIDPILETPPDYLASIIESGRVLGQEPSHYNNLTTTVLGKDNKNTILQSFLSSIEKYGIQN